MKSNIKNKRYEMAGKKLDETCDIMKDKLTETIDGVTQVAKQGSQAMFDALLKQGAESLNEILDIVGKKLKDKVGSNVKSKT
jgi:hypothetical protein